MNGDTNSLTAVQVRGLRTFLEVGCAECHDGALLGGTPLRKFGIFHEYWGATGSARPDEGLALTTRQETDRYRFRVAMLRNIALTAPYFHDGSVDRLERAVQIMAQVQLGRTLTDTDTASIVEFLRSLTGGVPENYRPPVPAPPAP